MSKLRKMFCWHKWVIFNSWPALCESEYRCSKCGKRRIVTLADYY